ncbi:MAG: hypothetical protein H7039_05525 [Bryobacteraceae bacterium]|nr:hypothetical protein [Bryobacteraceae bacterium]
MTRPYKHPAVLLTVAWLVVFATRCALILNPPAGYFYNIDELEMTLSCLDRFLGVPSTSLQWPGSILQMLMMPVWIADLVIQNGIPRGMTAGLNSLGNYLAHAYANPVHSVTLLRLLVAAISSAAPIFAFGIASSLTNSKRVAWIAAGAIAFVPIFFRQSAMAMGEAAGLTFALGALFLIVRFGATRAFWAGFLFAAAIASRITLASLVVLPLLLLAFDLRQVLVKRIPGILRFCVGLFVGFLFWCPWVWTDPLRFAKAVLGHLGHHASLHPPAFFNVWLDAMGVSFTILTLLSVAGAIYALKSAALRVFAIPGLIATAIVTLPLVSAKVDLFPRYFLPLLPCIVLLAALTLAAVNNHRLIAGLFILASVGTFAESTIREQQLRGPDELAMGLHAAAELSPDTTLFLPEEALYLYRIPLPRAVYSRMQERVSTQLRDHSGVLAYLKQRGIPETAGSVLMTAFTEDEQALEARLRAASTLSGASGPNLTVYYDPGTVSGIVAERLSPADMTLDKAKAQYRENTQTAILLHNASPDLGQPLWKGARAWYLYKR